MHTRAHTHKHTHKNTHANTQTRTHTHTHTRAAELVEDSPSYLVDPRSWKAGGREEVAF